MLELLDEFLAKYSIANKNVVIAFSGGPDSVVLASLIKNVADKYNLKPVLCYFNHRWRHEAFLEEEFTKNFAQKMGFQFYIERAPENSKKNEETARNLRYDFLYKCAKNFKTDAVLLAHNKNDNVETLIYRIIKGTSVSGLTSIPEHRDIFYRPMLDISKEDILNYIKENNLEYMYDSSNDCSVHARNLIRKEILPLFAKINPNYLQNISSLIENAALSRKILDKTVLDIYEQISFDSKINYDKFVKLEKEYRYEILNMILYDKLKNRDKKTILKLDNFILNNRNSKISINSNLFLIVNNDRIFLDEFKPYQNYSSLMINKEGVYDFQNIKLSIKKVKFPKTFPLSGEKRCCLNLEFPVELRYRKQGDVFSPIGLKGKMKLKEYFINEKFPMTDRDKLILLAKGNDICWILGYKISENYKVSNDNCFFLEYEEINDDIG